MRLSPDTISQVVVCCQKIKNLEAIYVFGSYATGSNTESSDLDLGIKAAGKIDPVLLWEIGSEIGQRLKVDVDLIDMCIADTVLLMQIVSAGKRIYTSNHSASETFDSLIFAQYLKLNEDRAEILETIEKSGKVYG